MMQAESAIYALDQLRQIEIAAQQAGMNLMVEAGFLAAEWIASRFSPQSTVLAVVGPGNNGGDALVAACELRHRGFPVEILLCYIPLTDEAQAALDNARQLGIRIFDDWVQCLQSDIIIDGLFGVGLKRTLDEVAADHINQINALNGFIVALDTPSGLDPWRGSPTPLAVHADATLTFLGAKQGLWTASGRDYAGEVFVFPLSFPDHLRPPPSGELNHPAAYRVALLRRAHDSHKGSYGTLAVLGGADGMIGASLLAGRAALLSGAGKVQVGLLASQAPAVDFQQPELMLYRAGAMVPMQADCILLGPGLGHSASASTLLSNWMDSAAPLILDADAINLLANDPLLTKRLSTRKAPTVLTPHPAEASRLLGISVKEIQANRLAAATQIARHYQAVCVLKGAGTLIVRPDGYFSVNPTGNPGMASAGQGDVLGGIIAALISQGLPEFDAAALGVYVHGLAADSLAETEDGPIGAVASDTSRACRRMLNRLLAQQALPAL